MDMEISQKSNSFVVKKMIDKLVLDPSGVRNLKQSLKSELNSSLFRWKEKYGGALLNYRGLKLNNNEAEIFDEMPYLYVDVRYKATIFTPIAGDLLVGKITQIFSSHINLLVLGIFNAIIYQNNINAKIASFDNESMDWICRKNSKKLEIGDSLQFIIYKVEKDNNGNFNIEGALKSKKKTGLVSCIKQKYLIEAEFNEISNSIKIE